MKEFIGRQQELASLKALFDKKSASLVVIRGRRRIGKSRLIKEFANGCPFVYFSGLAPPNVSASMQRQEFARILCKRFNLPPFTSNDWGELFSYLAPHVSKGRHVVIFDEISWMATQDSAFLAQLKNAWDLHFSENPKLILILCGSVSSWIERNILSHTGFVGRISLDCIIEELPIRDCVKFWGAKGQKISSYEVFKLLSVTGGVPRYLEEISPKLTAEQNIQKLCFSRSGLLFREFEQIFSELFSKRAKTYRAIVEFLVKAPRSLKEIYEKLSATKGGLWSDYMDDLIQAGFVAEDATWNLKTRTRSTLKKYRLKDNYLRFYLKYVAPHRHQIKQDPSSVVDMTSLPNWLSMMGLQFENLVLSNKASVFEQLGIAPHTILCSGPFFQRATKTQKGCQIDLLIHTQHHNLYLCEIKFSSSPVGIKVIEEVKQKLNNISLPRGFSIRSVLIHVNGVTDEVLDANFFDAIIDFSQFLEASVN